MKKTGILMSLASLLILSSCKKDGVPATTGLASGYWKAGFLGGGTTFNLLNRDDGTSRLYILISTGDTANADSKLEGSYRVSEEIFIAHYTDTSGTFDLQSSLITRNYMNGIFLVNNTGALAFEGFRQQ